MRDDAISKVLAEAYSMGGGSNPVIHQLVLDAMTVVQLTRIADALERHNEMEHDVIEDDE